MQQKIIFTLGMDSDNSPESDKMQMPGKARHRVNVRVLSSDNDETGAIETMLGNSLVSYSLPAGNNVVIGSKEDIKTKKIYYFVFNDALAHSILEYNYATNIISLVLREAVSAPYYLNFSSDFLITGINVVELDSENHLLYWTDNYVNPGDENDYNEPKKVNIEKAKLHSAGDYINGYPAPFEPRFITRIKQPPSSSPTYIWSTDSDQKINYLFKKLFQFKVQFVYDDNEVSAWSPISRYEFPSTVNAGGSGEDFNIQDNKITLTVPTGSGIVKRIRIAGKQLGLTDFSLIADFSKDALGISSDSTYDFPFYNDGNYVQLEINESIRLFDWVPLRSQAQEIIAGQRIVDGLITENFDPVHVDMRLPITFEEFTPPSNNFFVDKTFLKSGGVYDYGIVYYDEWGNRSGLTNTVKGKSTEYTGSVFGTTLYVPFVTDPLYDAPHGSPNEDMKYVPEVTAELYHAPPSWAKRYQILRSTNKSMGRYFQFVAQEIRYTDINGAVVAPALAVYCTLDLGSIIGRYLYENGDSKLVYDYADGDRIRFIANPAYTSTSPYLPTAVTGIDSFFSFNDTEILSWDSGTQVLNIRINPSLPTVPLNLLPGCLFEIYQPAESVINDNELMYEIAEEGNIVADQYGNLVHSGSTINQMFVPLASSSYVGTIYTCVVPLGHGLNVGENVKFYNGLFSVYGVVSAIGATTVSIDTAGFTLVGIPNSGPGTIVRASETVLSSGDCFRRLCDMPYFITGFVSVYRLYSYIEASSASYLFTSNASDYGRVNRIDPEIKRVTRPSTIYYSENFIPETGINGLSTVYDENYQTYSQAYGGIYKLRTKDIGLIMMQELKISMIPVGRIIYNDLSLQSTVGASSAVLSPETSPYAGEIGIGRNPESHAEYNNVDYGIDVNRGVVWRLSNDGLTPISDVGDMHNFFSDKCNAYLNANQYPRVYGVYDIKFNEYVVAFERMIQGEQLPAIEAETLAWNEKYNQWSTFYSFHPEGMCPSNTGFISFKDGGLWKHNENIVYGSFYGSVGEPEFWVYCNANPSNVKVLTAISQETNSAWEVYSISTPNGQESSLIVSDFEEKENNQYAGVLKDSNTPNVSLPLIEGDVMRDRTFLVKFRYTGTDYNKINAVNFYYIASNLSNRN